MSESDEDQLLREAELTAKGFFVIAFEQFPCWQGFFINREISRRERQSLNTTLDQVTYMMLRMFLGSGISGDPGARTMTRNQNQVGVLGSVMRDYLGYDFFLIEGKLEGKSLTHTVMTFTADSVRDGRSMIMKTPLVMNIRNRLLT